MGTAALFRRLRTVTTAFATFAAVTATLPLTIPLAVAIDAGRAMVRRRPWMTIRLLAMVWLFLCAQFIELSAMGAIWLVAGLGRRRRFLAEATRRIDLALTVLGFRAARAVFRLAIEIDGDEQAGPGPVVALVRHAGIVDTLLPGVLMARPHGLRLRWVLSRRLLRNPVVDVWGHRWPNHFVGVGDPRRDLAAIRALTEGLTERDAVVIFPEGARATPSRRAVVLQSLARHRPDLAEQAASLRHVLPPHPAGTLALVDPSAPADVVIVAHAGLEGFGSLREAWAGAMVGTTAYVAVWRISADQIPGAPEERLSWLMGWWRTVDGWIDARRGE